MKSLLLLWMVMFITTSHAWERKDYLTVYGTTEVPVTICWNAGTGRHTHFEIYLESAERGDKFPLDNIPYSGTHYEYPVTIPRTGHWLVRLRSCNADKCSPWIKSESIDPATSVCKGTTSQTGPFWIYGHIAKPGGIIIK